MKDFPEGNPEIQDTNSGYCAANPTGGNNRLQTVITRFPTGVEQKVIVSPIAKAERTLRYPRQECQDNADLEAQDDVEDNAQFRRHGSCVLLNNTGKSFRLGV
jgi:hypothetical protein